jgi:hypothetical protein
MATALKTRPNLQFKMPDSVKMASWDTGFGQRTDAFKNGQDPGATQGAPPEPGGETIDRETIGQYMDRKLGVGPKDGVGIKRTAHASELGFMTHDEAAAFLASVDKQETK